MISWFRKRGQIASFMIAVIVILLIGLMVTVNLGKVAMNKTHASNAADAGALAGSSGYNSTLNNLAYQNWLMITAYLTEEITFLWPMSICSETLRFVEWNIYWVAATTDFYLALQAGEDGYKAARNSARQLALVNSGIDQPKAGRETGESYNDWLIKKSEFEEKMDDKFYEKNDSSTIYYNWTDRVKYGQTGSSGGDNQVKVDVNGPDFPGLWWQSMVLVGLFKDGWFPACEPECGLLCESCILCSIELGAYYACLTAIGATAVPVIIPFTEEAGPLCVPCGGGYFEVSVTGGTVHGDPMAWIMPSATGCGGVAWNTIIYTVPIAYIANIKDDDPEIEVTVTKKEPRINLGLWRMNYDDPNQAGQGITSSAKAKTSGGRVGVSPKQSYDSHLIEVSK